MRLEELVNENYVHLNENDLLIWRYIERHRRECSRISIEELARICCISRTTISRFTQKLGFSGFGEFKMRLKMECEGGPQIQADSLLADVCSNYIRCIEAARDTDMEDICRHIRQANRLFAFGTGEVQQAAARMLKRMFANLNRFFVTIHGKSEVNMAIENLDQRDVVILFSLSGENELALQTARKLKSRGAYTVSVTRLCDNSLAALCDRKLYITTSVLMNVGDTAFETTSSYFNLTELLCVKYLIELSAHPQSSDLS